MPKLREMFLALDADGSGDISKEELINGLESDPAMKDQILELLGSADPLEIFDMLDTDGGGEISVDEFCENILKAVTSDRPMELERIMKLVKGVPKLSDEI